MTGSFIASDFEKDFESMKKKIQQTVTEIFQFPDTNFLSSRPIDSLVIQKGSNLLESCFQYEVREKLGAKLLNIKAYDKILDLVGREATHLVSSRLSKVLSSGSTPGAFERLISRN